VWTALGAARAGALALDAARVLALLLVHGLTLLPGEHGYASLCYEVARVAANGTFDKMLALAAAPPAPPPAECAGLAALRAELTLLGSVGEEINARVRAWLDARPPGAAYSELDALSVVAEALLALALPVRRAHARAPLRLRLPRPRPWSHSRPRPRPRPLPWARSALGVWRGQRGPAGVGGGGGGRGGGAGAGGGAARRPRGTVLGAHPRPPRPRCPRPSMTPARQGCGAGVGCGVVWCGVVW